jgi:nicotinamidase-related amidase
VDLTRSALILIDFQNDFLHSQGLLSRSGNSRLSDPARQSLITNTRALVDGMKKAGRPVVWIKTVLRRDHADSALSPAVRDSMGLTAEKGFLVEGSRGSEVIEEIQPGPDDFVVVKKGHSIFQFTHLDRLLANLGVDTFIAAGGAGLDCLADSIRQGGALGYEMLIPADATGYPPESPHLKNLKNRAVLTTTSNLLAELRPSAALPVKPSKTALLLIDLQNEFVHPHGFHERLGYAHMSPEERELVIRNNQRLLQGMREKGQPVIFVITLYRKDRLDDASSPTAIRNRPMPPGEDYLIAGTWGARVHEGLEVRDEDFVIPKKGRSCFGFTPLHRVLRNLKVDRCIVTGGGIYGCVEDSIREGAGFGYRFTVVSDATYEPNSPVLKILAERADCKSTDEVLAELKNPLSS